VNNKGMLDAKLLPKGLLGNLMLFQLLKRIAHFSRTAGSTAARAYCDSGVQIAVKSAGKLPLEFLPAL